MSTYLPENAERLDYSTQKKGAPVLQKKTPQSQSASESTKEFL